MEKITEVDVLPIYRMDDWVFRTSLSNGKNIMIIAYNQKLPRSSFKLQFFTELAAAKAWVDEVVIGKHD